MKNKKLLLYSVFAVLIPILVLYTTHASGYDNDASRVVDNVRRLFLVLEAVVILKLTLIISRSEIKDQVKNYGIGFCSVLITVMIAELFFMHVPRSYGKGDTKILAERLWFTKYWEVNSLGFRDPEPSPNTSKRKIMVVGDSFVAGHGIEQPQDRFTGQLQTLLGEQYEVYNLGVNGADTQAEYNKLLNFPLKPDLIILAHFANDIERVPRQTALKVLEEPNILTASLGPSASGGYLIENSYLLNYFYNKFGASKIFSDNKRGVTTKEELAKPHQNNNYLSFYLDPNMQQEHMRNLYQFVQLSKQEQIPLFVLLLPETWNETIDFSENYINLPIQAFFEEQDVPVLDAYSIFKEIPIEERVVNSNDAHPSVLVHKKIAETLLKSLNQHSLL